MYSHLIWQNCINTLYWTSSFFFQLYVRYIWFPQNQMFIILHTDSLNVWCIFLVDSTVEWFWHSYFQSWLQRQQVSLHVFECVYITWYGACVKLFTTVKAGRLFTSWGSWVHWHKQNCYLQVWALQLRNPISFTDWKIHCVA